MIEFESVGKTFRDGTPAVVDLTLTVPSDKITVIVGPSGCGKTTTLRMVNRMLEPTSGRIVWDGAPLKSKRKTVVRRQMGYVIQSGGLFPHRTVVENIGTVPGLLGWDKDKTRKRAMELLGSVGLDRKLAHRYPAQLSGGQQQRVGVARALAADPLVLLMDEPFSAVDPVVRAELHEFFLSLQREISKTIILITHDIDEAIKLGDQVAILRVGGRLAQVGTPQQLLDEPADAFVEGFVGKDRGYRSLSFLPASSLSLERVPVVRDVDSADSDGPTLVVDGDARPVGWAHRDRPGQVFPLGSTFTAESDTLRTALDSALTSPHGLAVAVAPDTGRFAGVVGADQILAQVREARTATVETVTVAEAEERVGQDSEYAPLAADEDTGEPAEDTVSEPVDGRDDEDLRTEPAEATSPDTETVVSGEPVDLTEAARAEPAVDRRYPETPVDDPAAEDDVSSGSTSTTNPYLTAPTESEDRVRAPEPAVEPDTRWASGRSERGDDSAWTSLAQHVGGSHAFDPTATGETAPDQEGDQPATDADRNGDQPDPPRDEASTDTVVIDREPDRDPTR